MVKNPPAMWETWVQSLGGEDLLEGQMDTHSIILAWESYGQRSLEGYSPWGHKELDGTEPQAHRYHIVLISSSVDGHTGCFHFCE